MSRMKDKRWLWEDGGHPIDVEDEDSAFFCEKCERVDKDETHWEDGEHIHDADW